MFQGFEIDNIDNAKVGNEIRWSLNPTSVQDIQCLFLNTNSVSKSYWESKF